MLSAKFHDPLASGQLLIPPFSLSWFEVFEL